MGPALIVSIACKFLDPFPVSEARYGWSNISRWENRFELAAYALGMAVQVPLKITESLRMLIIELQEIIVGVRYIHSILLQLISEVFGEGCRKDMAESYRPIV